MKKVSTKLNHTFCNIIFARYPKGIAKKLFLDVKNVILFLKSCSNTNIPFLKHTDFSPSIIHTELKCFIVPKTPISDLLPHFPLRRHQEDP